MTNRIDGCRPAFAHRYARWCSGDNAIERYALFLTLLALSTDLTERRTALQRTREHGLDIPRAVIVTAEHTIEHSLDNLPSRHETITGSGEGSARASGRGRDTSSIDRVGGRRGRRVRYGAGTGECFPGIPVLCVLLSSCLSSLAMFYGADLCLRYVSSRKSQCSAFAPRHAPAITGSYWYARRMCGRIFGLSPVPCCLGNTRARDGVPVAGGSPKAGIRTQHGLRTTGYALFIFPFPSGVFSSSRMQDLVSSVREQILKLLTMDWLVPETDVPAST